MAAALEKKNQFLIKALVLALSIHFIFLFAVTFTLPVPPIPFKPKVSFLGSLFKTQDLFNSIFDQRVPVQTKGEIKGFEFTSSKAEDYLRQFSVDKPKIEDRQRTKKETRKTTFAVKEEVKESSQDDFPAAEHFSLKPLKLERP